VFVPLQRVRTHRNADKRGTYRWYNDYRLPEHLGGGIVTVRLHANDEDRQRKFDRAENVRQIPPGDPDFETLYRRRNDAESINRHLHDTLWLRRAHSVGARRQLLNLITYAMGVNATSMHVHRRGLASPVAADGPHPGTPGSGAAPQHLDGARRRRSRPIVLRGTALSLYAGGSHGRPRTSTRVFSQVFCRSRASSSMVEQRAFNPLVQGSKPWGRTTSKLMVTLIERHRRGSATPIALSDSRYMAAAPDAVWARIADHEIRPDWYTDLTEVTSTSGGEGVDGVRKVSMPGVTVDEVFMAWKSPNRLAFTMIARPRIIPSMAELAEIWAADGCARSPIVRASSPALGSAGSRSRPRSVSTAGRARLSERLAGLFE
jgi:hypothetical protein